MPSKLPWPEILVTALVVLAGAGVYLYAHRDEGALEESKRRGEQLVEALRAYESAHGTYPDALADLVPEHIETIEPPTWGLQRWRYRRYSPADAIEAAADSGGRRRSRPASLRADSSTAEGAVPREQPSDHAYFQLSVAADESGYPVLYYDFASHRWVY